MKLHLNEIDPLPKLDGEFERHQLDRDGYWYLMPMSRRETDEAYGDSEEDFEKFAPTGTRDHLEINGYGQLKYAPPEPDTDIVILFEEDCYTIKSGSLPKEPWVTQFEADLAGVRTDPRFAGLEHTFRLDGLRGVYGK